MRIKNFIFFLILSTFHIFSFSHYSYGSELGDLKVKSNFKISNSQHLGYFEKYWLQYSNEGDLLFRYLINDNKKSCPSISVDKLSMQSSERDHEYLAEFPVKICQLVIDNSKDHIIKFKTMSLKTKRTDIKKISVLGDTGCITEGNILEQDCRSKENHPFSEVAFNVAKEKPDLIVHVGDYFYSKKECLDKSKCDGRPFGDNIDTWRADFIDEASVFFNSAPIIFTRGNHESCERGGKGWSVLFDPSKNFRSCTDYTDPYIVDLEKMRFLVVDSAKAIDTAFLVKKLSRFEKENQINEYTRQFNNLASLVKNDKQNILISHRPIFSKEIRPWISKKIFDINYVLNKAINKSDFKKSLSNISLILSGHTHTGFLIDISDKENNHLYQVVSGNGGAYLYKEDTFSKSNNKIFNKKATLLYNNKDFGYSNLVLKDSSVINRVEFCNWNGNKVDAVNLNYAN